MQLSAHNPGPVYKTQAGRAAGKAPDRPRSADKEPGKLARSVEQQAADKAPDKVEQPDQSPAVEQQVEQQQAADKEPDKVAPQVEQAEQHMVADNMDFAPTPSARCPQSPRSPNSKWHS